MVQDFADNQTKPVPGGDVAIEPDRGGRRVPFQEAIAASCFAFGFNGKRRSRVQRKGETVKGAWCAIPQFQLHRATPCCHRGNQVFFESSCSNSSATMSTVTKGAQANAEQENRCSQPVD
jgi:hypothetical protein